MVLAVLFAQGAQASFHLMQIEQAFGGFCADPSQQAVQLRMRSGGQNLVAGKRLVAYDQNGLSPVVLITFPANAAISSAGSRILVASSALTSSHGVTADFTMTNLIPAEYLAAGKITFQDSGGGVYWSLAWGGAGYTGGNAGMLDNDPDGNFGPPFGGALPSSTHQALRFQGAASAQSTNNAADYALTTGAAIFTMNSGVATMIVECLFGDGFESGDTSAWSSAVP